MSQLSPEHELSLECYRLALQTFREAKGAVVGAEGEGPLRPLEVARRIRAFVTGEQAELAK